jgi:O-antigen/teichoic acid export membrane protein
MDKKSNIEYNRLAKKSIIFTASKIGISLSNVFLFILLSYFFSKSEYGSFRQVWLVNKSLMEVFAFGVPISIFYFLPRLADNQKKIFVIQSIIILSVSGFCFSTIVFLFAKKIALFFNNFDLENYLKIFCLYPFFVLPILGIQSISISLDRTTPFAIISLIDRMLFLLLAGLAVIYFRSLEGLFFTLIIFSSIEFICYMYIVFYFTKSYKIPTIKFKFRKQLKFAIPIGLANIVGILSQELDKLMIGAFFSVVQFARYANGAFEIPFVGTISASISSVLLPEYSKKYKDGDYQSLLLLWHSAICKVAMFLIPLMIFFFIFAKDFISILFSTKYIDSTIIFQIYVIALIPKITWYGPILVSMGHSKEPLYGSGVALISNIILNYTFIKIIGFTGPAIATVLTTYIVVFYYIYRISNVTRVSFFKVFPWMIILKMLTFSIIIGLFIFPVAYIKDASSITKLCIGMVGYFGMIFHVFKRFEIISNNDIEFVKNLIHKLH